MGRKKEQNVTGYNPNKEYPSMKQLECPYCWYAHHNKSILSRHINQYHWDKLKEDNKTAKEVMQ